MSKLFDPDIVIGNSEIYYSDLITASAEQKILIAQLMFKDYDTDYNDQIVFYTNLTQNKNDEFEKASIKRKLK